MNLDARYVESLWRSFQRDPAAVPQDWCNAFGFVEMFWGDPFGGTRPTPRDEQSNLREYFRRFGHRHADLDPLGLTQPEPLPGMLRDDTALAWPGGSAYLRTMAVETGHLDCPEMSAWVTATFERTQSDAAGPDPQIYRQLIETEVFDQFLATKLTGKKRFGSEGADAVVPLLHAIRAAAAEDGVDEIVVGSMHRGRLSIMANVVGKDPAELLAEMTGEHPFSDASDLPADVPYHLGHVYEAGGVRTTLLPNPSHLEAINPVAMGYARARRDRGSRALAVILHTDASVIGQGVNAELLQMSGLPGFATGGIVHVVINNQVGFTTAPSEARTSRYCTGAWRAVDSLLVHINGDDVDAVVRGGRLALLFRAQFARDAVIDLVCYRANGHNEIDEPRFTQPAYYRAADAKRSVAALYEARMVDARLLTATEAAAHRAAIRARLDAAWERKAVPAAPPAPANRVRRTADLSERALDDVIERLSHVPAGLGNQKMIALMDRRRAERDAGISWALAEAMAFASALRAGVSVRFCGQDVERGPFSQRHLAAVHPETGGRHHPMAAFCADGASFAVVNSPLSEYAVLGFEYGYSLAAPDSLTVWEAQFGDFANGAQIMLDQFIASGAEKWQQRSSLAVLLPHGLEGQGPEHSSARIERLLQLCARDNVVVAHPSTPANYFHLLLEQATAGDRPLFVLTPKMLLRLPEARSALADFADSAGFRPVIAAGAAIAARAVLCSGKIAYEIEKMRAAEDVAVTIIRLERLYPFPGDKLVAALRRSGATELSWVQEEPANFGAATWLGPQLARVAADAGVQLNPVVARGESASPAGGFHYWHEREQTALIRRALALDNEHAN